MFLQVYIGFVSFWIVISATNFVMEFYSSLDLILFSLESYLVSSFIKSFVSFWLDNLCFHHFYLQYSSSEKEISVTCTVPSFFILWFCRLCLVVFLLFVTSFLAGSTRVHRSFSPRQYHYLSAFYASATLKLQFSQGLRSSKHIALKSI